MDYRNGEYFLTNQESGILFGQSIHPDEVIMERRNRFFAEMDESLQITCLPDGGMLIEASDFEIPDLPEHLMESFSLDTDAFFCKAYHYSYSIAMQNSCIREAA